MMPLLLITVDIISLWNHIRSNDKDCMLTKAFSRCKISNTKR